MRIDPITAVVALVLLVGCSPADDPNDHDHTHSNNHHTHSNNELSNNGGSNGHIHDMGHAHDGDADHDPIDLAGIDLGNDVTITPAAEDYCECLLITCHDPFHDKYGEDDADAIAACQRDASGYPVAGSEQMSGDSIECRQYHCDNAQGDSNCDNALGAACM